MARLKKSARKNSARTVKKSKMKSSVSKKLRKTRSQRKSRRSLVPKKLMIGGSKPNYDKFFEIMLEDNISRMLNILNIEGIINELKAIDNAKLEDIFIHSFDEALKKNLENIFKNDNINFILQTLFQIRELLRNELKIYTSKPENINQYCIPEESEKHLNQKKIEILKIIFPEQLDENTKLKLEKKNIEALCDYNNNFFVKYRDKIQVRHKGKEEGTSRNNRTFIVAEDNTKPWKYLNEQFVKIKVIIENVEETIPYLLYNVSKYIVTGLPYYITANLEKKIGRRKQKLKLRITSINDNFKNAQKTISKKIREDQDNKELLEICIFYGINWMQEATLNISEDFFNNFYNNIVTPNHKFDSDTFEKFSTYYFQGIQETQNYLFMKTNP